MYYYLLTTVFIEYILSIKKIIYRFKCTNLLYNSIYHNSKLNKHLYIYTKLYTFLLYLTNNNYYY